MQTKELTSRSLEQNKRHKSKIIAKFSPTEKQLEEKFGYDYVQGYRYGLINVKPHKRKLLKSEKFIQGWNDGVIDHKFSMACIDAIRMMYGFDSLYNPRGGKIDQN